MNDYNQHGNYYIKAFANRPTVEQLAPHIDENMLPNTIGEAIKFCAELIKKGTIRIGSGNNAFGEYYLIEEELA